MPRQGLYVELIIPSDLDQENLGPLVSELVMAIAANPEQFSFHEILNFLQFKSQKGQLPFDIRSRVVDMDANNQGVLEKDQQKTE